MPGPLSVVCTFNNLLNLKIALQLCIPSFTYNRKMLMKYWKDKAINVKRVAEFQSGTCLENTQ